MTQPVYLYRARLDRVLDGDSMKFAIDVGFSITAHVTVRLRNLYTAEAHEPGGAEATARAEAVLRAAKTILIQTQKTKAGTDVQSFTRYVGDVFVDGELLADKLRTDPPAGIGAPR